jgi:hypothetical protein
MENNRLRLSLVVLRRPLFAVDIQVRKRIHTSVLFNYLEKHETHGNKYIELELVLFFLSVSPLRNISAPVTN